MAAGKFAKMPAPPAMPKFGADGKKKVKTVPVPKAGSDLFKTKAKSPETDNVGRLFRPTAHAPKQAAVARRAAATVKRLSNRKI